MDKVNVTIHVVATAPETLKNYDPAKDGKTRSTENQIKALKVTDGYSVVFDDDVFVEISLAKLMSSIVQVFASNIKNSIFDFRLMYHYEGATDTYFDFDTAKHVLDLDDMMCKIRDAKSIPVFMYTRTDNMQEVYTDFRNEVEDNTPEPISRLFDDDDNDEDEDNEDSLFASLLGIDDKDKKEKKSKKDKEYYGRSRVWKNCRNPKKQINRHGVMIADKSDLKKDEKIIKSFLKDFLPGGASWKKEFRSDVLERWMNMYAISKKHLKELEKAHRRRRPAKRRSSTTDKILNFSEKLLAVPVDRWADPTK